MLLHGSISPEIKIGWMNKRNESLNGNQSSSRSATSWKSNKRLAERTEIVQCMKNENSSIYFLKIFSISKFSWNVYKQLRYSVSAKKLFSEEIFCVWLVGFSAEYNSISTDWGTDWAQFFDKMSKYKIMFTTSESRNDRMTRRYV